MPYKEEYEGKDPKVVALGGGTGLSILLRGLKQLTADIVAIVAVTDDGGGSGVLREDLGMLPPGDIRNCILSLSNREPLMTELLKYRFEEGRLKGQNFGNLLIAAMVGISDSFEEAIRKINLILNVTGKVLPVSNEDIELHALLKNGLQIKGESNIPYQVLKGKTGIEKVFILPESPSGLPEAVDEIGKADIILLGPGSLFTSIIPNILIHDINNALDQAPAPKVFITNLMTQPGETDDFTLKDHLEAFCQHAGSCYLTHVLVNNGTIPEEVLARYKREGSTPVYATEEDKLYLTSKGIELIEGDFTEIKKGYLRHDAYKVSQQIMGHINQ